MHGKQNESKKFQMFDDELNFNKASGFIEAFECSMMNFAAFRVWELQLPLALGTLFFKSLAIILFLPGSCEVRKFESVKKRHLIINHKNLQFRFFLFFQFSQIH